MCVLLEEFHNLLVEKLEKVNLDKINVYFCPFIFRRLQKRTPYRLSTKLCLSFDTCRLKESTNGEFVKKT